MELFALFQVLMDSSTSIYAGHIGDIELSSIAVYQGVINSIYFYLLVSTLIINLVFFSFDLYNRKLNLPNPLMSKLAK